MISRITKCRICNNSKLDLIVSLGHQSLTGVFPKSSTKKILGSPLTLLKCSRCGFVQLEDTVKRELLYGETYGYRSGINQVMVQHLNKIVKEVSRRAWLAEGDVVVDIGSNDGTLLKMYSPCVQRFGIDPLGKKFKAFYPKEITLIPRYFSSKLVQKAKVITSIAMFYDLDDPIGFMREVKESLVDDGIWITEQSYMPTMIRRTAYDIICHEHLGYYGLTQIKYMADKVGFKIIDVSFNTINGGSFRVTLAKHGKECGSKIKKIIDSEKFINFDLFKKRVWNNYQDLIILIYDLVFDQHKTVMGYGASTKGNVILQFCRLSGCLEAIADRNPEKIGKVTPGTHIPIISESQMRIEQPDYLLVLPYHFKKDFIEREQTYLKRGGAMIFPLPKIQIVKS